MISMNVFKVTKHRDHHGRGGGVADPHGEEGGGKHEPEHQVGWTRSLGVRKLLTVAAYTFLYREFSKFYVGCQQL